MTSPNRKSNRQKEAAKKRPQTWKPGQSGNPRGAPKRGESWAEVIKRYGEMTPAQAAEESLELSKKLLSIGDGVTLKQAVILRVYAALLFEPEARLLNALMDRAEGKVPQATHDMDKAEWAEWTGKSDSELVAEFNRLMVSRGAKAGSGDTGGAGEPGKP